MIKKGLILMASMGEVARIAGVGKATVSRVLNNGVASDEVRQKVLAACKMLDYQLNSNIQDLVKKGRSGFTGNLAFVLVDRALSDPSYASYLDEIARQVNERHLHLMLVTLQSGAIGSIYDLPPVLRDNRVDGLLVTGKLNEKLLAVLAQKKIPMVLMGNYPAELIADYAYFAPNHVPLLTEGVHEALQQGCRRFAFAAESRESFFDREQRERLSEILGKNGLLLANELCYYGRGEKCGVTEVLDEVFRRDELPFDVIFASDGRIGEELAFLSAKRSGFAQPEELLIVSRFHRVPGVRHYSLPIENNLVVESLNILLDLQKKQTKKTRSVKK